MIVGSDKMEIKTLDQLKIGEKGKVLKLDNQGTIRRRLLDIGLTPGTLVECTLESPFHDPVAYKIRNATIALRKEDSKLIQIEVVEE